MRRHSILSMVVAATIRRHILTWAELPAHVKDVVSARLAYMAENGGTEYSLDRNIVAYNAAPKGTKNHYKWRATARKKLRIPTVPLERHIVQMAIEEISNIHPGSGIKNESNSPSITLYIKATHKRSVIDILGEDGMSKVIDIVRDLNHKILPAQSGMVNNMKTNTIQSVVEKYEKHTTTAFFPGAGILAKMAVSAVSAILMKVIRILSVEAAKTIADGLKQDVQFATEMASFLYNGAGMNASSSATIVEEAQAFLRNAHRMAISNRDRRAEAISTRYNAVVEKITSYVMGGGAARDAAKAATATLIVAGSVKVLNMIMGVPQVGSTGIPSISVQLKNASKKMSKHADKVAEAGKVASAVNDILSTLSMFKNILEYKHSPAEKAEEV